MKVHPIVKKSLLFLIILIAVNEGIKLYFYSSIAENMLLVKRDKAFHNVKGVLDYLFLGHSRPVSAIDTTGRSQIFNFASGGESNIYTYYKLKYILEESGIDAKTIVLPFGFGTYNMRDAEHTTNSFYWKKYVDYLEVGSARGEWFDYLGVELKARLFPYFQHPSRALDRGYMKMTGEINHRSKMEAIPADERFEKAYESILHNHTKRALYDSISVEYLKKTIALCKAHDKQMVFVKYPVSVYYFTAAQRFVADHKLKVWDVVDVIRQSDANAVILDYETLYTDKDRYFRDLNHLNPEGAAEFTRTLMADLHRKSL